MINTKLILVDGLPGSGKSTIAQFIALQVEKNGIRARWFYELEQAHPIHAFHVWSRQGPAQFIRTITENWQTFVAQRRAMEEVSILESSIFQSTVRLLFQSDVPRHQITEYAFQIETIIAELDPVLIYFVRTDVAHALKEICEKRKKVWENYLTQVIDCSEYAKHHHLQNFEGMVTFFQRYQELTTSLVSHFTMPRLTIENPNDDWAACRQRICRFLALPRREDPEVSEQYLAQFTGRYRDESTRLEIRIGLNHDGLIVHDLLWPRSKLLPKTANSFYVEGCTIEIDFQEDATGNIYRMKIGGSPGWKLYGRTLVKVDEL
ncbi:hypothetical protein GF339_20750 [candidate division KSB3 bacterium]|uniref:Uncharacterized protein n=1 Tax=candidate division KSB3 bacterium TaxID=2044937 RepID=A0A9D5Q819_9BACT|nr:hypothetical protein [candidate division KSB3 bacterium]MBD3327028.1 hypothetical protein [candidate division KSB3 bacterium]